MIETAVEKQSKRRPKHHGCIKLEAHKDNFLNGIDRYFSRKMNLNMI